MIMKFKNQYNSVTCTCMFMLKNREFVSRAKWEKASFCSVSVHKPEAKYIVVVQKFAQGKGNNGYVSGYL